jgi:hypothetical protein
MSNNTDLDIEADIAFVQGKRKEIVYKLMPDGKPPSDTKEMSILLTALDGIDRSALTRLRIKSDEKTADSMVGGAAIIAKALGMISPQNFMQGDVTDAEVKPPQLGSGIPAPVLSPGEVEEGTRNISYKEVMSAIPLPGEE